MSASTPRADAPVKIEVKNDPDDYYDAGYFNFQTQDGLFDPSATATATSTAAISTAGKPTKRIPGPSRGPLKHSAPKPVLHVNRRRLSRILRDLARAHKWREASGVLSVLLRGTPCENPAAEDRRNFMIAMELNKRFGAGNYQRAIKQIYDSWTSKLAWTRKCEKKKNAIQLELALFYLAQGNVAEAHNATRFLVQDLASASEPTVNLIHGLILYQLWYSDLIKELPMKGFHIDMFFETSRTSVDDDNEEPETVESSNDRNAVDVVDANFSSRYASESSVDNNMVCSDCKNDLQRKKSHDVFRAHEFYMSRSADMNEESAGSPIHDSKFADSSIFLADGLDSSLLPLRLKHSSGNLEQSIYSYRRLANEQYRDALRHLRLALYSTPPLLAALLPLIQLLLLGDQVGEALKELEKSCNTTNMALPFRLRGRLLEVFQSNQTTKISSCYENVLKRDPTCNNSLERLIKMHRTGNYCSMPLLEMIVLHLDAADGNCDTWGEFASCFLKLLNAPVSEYEDRISANVGRSQTEVISSCKIPKALTEGHARDVWRVRCRWWVTRHFSNNAFLSEMQAGDWKLLACKAACAAHLYGPRFQYVISVLSSLRKEGESDQMSFLCLHMKNSMKLHENLD